MLEKLILYMVNLQAQESKMQLTPSKWLRSNAFILLQERLL